MKTGEIPIMIILNFSIGLKTSRYGSDRNLYHNNIDDRKDITEKINALAVCSTYFKNIVAGYAQFSDNCLTLFDIRLHVAPKIPDFYGYVSVPIP